MIRRLLSLSLVTTLPLLSAATAFAQEAPPPPPAVPTTTVPGAPGAQPGGPSQPPPPPHGGHGPHGGWNAHEPPPAPLATAPVSPVPGPVAADLHARRVPTTIDSADKNAVIERRITSEESEGRIVFVVPFHAENETWEQVCVAPCKVDLDRYSSYRVARANGIPSTHEFTLPPNAQSLNLKVEPGNLAWNRVGTRLAATGTAAAIVGGALIIGAAKFDDEKDVRVGGIVTAGAGLLLLAVGIPLAIINQTHVTTDEKKLADNDTKKNAGPKLGLGGVSF